MKQAKKQIQTKQKTKETKNKNKNKNKKKTCDQRSTMQWFLFDFFTTIGAYGPTKVGGGGAVRERVGNSKNSLSAQKKYLFLPSGS